MPDWQEISFLITQLCSCLCRVECSDQLAFLYVSERESSLSSPLDGETDLVEGAVNLSVSIFALFILVFTQPAILFLTADICEFKVRINDWIRFPSIFPCLVTFT